FSSRRRHTRFKCDWSSDVCSSDLGVAPPEVIGVMTPTLGGRAGHETAASQFLRVRRAAAGESGTQAPLIYVSGGPFISCCERDEIGRASCRERGESDEGDVV